MREVINEMKEYDKILEIKEKVGMIKEKVREI